MNVFLLPVELTQSIEKLMTKFWWNGTHWMSWKRLCVHKEMGGMSFRNLKDFNIAMLAKQGWRLLTQPNSLVSQIFRARYYSQGSFLTAEMGSNPSFVWRSIREAQQLVRCGSRWKVGSGNDISIQHDPWLPSQDPFISSELIGLTNSRVSSLMHPNEHRWDEELLRDIFNERDFNLIMDIPLLSSTRVDTIIWTKETSGQFSVKSAYRLLQEQAGSWSHSAADLFWKKLWHLKIPPKIKDLVWRAASGCLPTMVQLQTRHVPFSRTCPRCHEEFETTLHALVTCPAAKEVWALIGILPSTSQTTDFFDWFKSFFMGSSNELRCSLATLCWAIWRARNSKVWDNKTSPARIVKNAAMSYLNQWSKAQSSANPIAPSGLISGDGASFWSKPPPAALKLNVDGALFEDTSSYGFSLIVRDSNGFLVEGHTRLSRGQLDPASVEAMGIREALSWLKRNPSQHAIVESDCLVAIQAIRSSCHMASIFGDIIQDCKSLLKSLPNTKVMFILRSANKIAHSFARASCLYSDRTFSMGDVPTDLLPILVTEFEV